MNTTMKKLTAILAASCLLASLAACKGPETEPGATDSTLQNTAGQSWESQAISESRNQKKKVWNPAEFLFPIALQPKLLTGQRRQLNRLTLRKNRRSKIKNRQRKRRSSPISM